MPVSEPSSGNRADIRPPDHEDRMRAAEDVARWYLGDRGWAGKIIGAYLWPDESREGLAREMGDNARSRAF